MFKVNFEHVIAGWERLGARYIFELLLCGGRFPMFTSSISKINLLLQLETSNNEHD